MLKHDDPEIRSLALLIQLFGRDVMDRIREVGFDNPIAIARAGPETLAARGEIALPLARRIVAVAMETEGIGDLPDPSPAPPQTRAPAARRRGAARRERSGAPVSRDDVPGGPPPALDDAAPPVAASGAAFAAPVPAGSRPARERRRPGRGGRLEAGNPGDPEQKPAPAASIDTASDASIDTPPCDADPFVDDAALISWMGFNARTGLPRTTSIAVADAILDPAAPAEPASPAGPASPPAAAADPGPAPTGSEAARRTSPPTVAGSFWSFGRRRRPAGEGGEDGR